MLQYQRIKSLQGMVRFHTGGIARELIISRFGENIKFNSKADSKVWMKEEFKRIEDIKE